MKEMKLSSSITLQVCRRGEEPAFAHRFAVANCTRPCETAAAKDHQPQRSRTSSVSRSPLFGQLYSF